MIKIHEYVQSDQYTLIRPQNYTLDSLLITFLKSVNTEIEMRQKVSTGPLKVDIARANAGFTGYTYLCSIGPLKSLIDFQNKKDVKLETKCNVDFIESLEKSQNNENVISESICNHGIDFVLKFSQEGTVEHLCSEILKNYPVSVPTISILSRSLGEEYATYIKKRPNENCFTYNENFTFLCMDKMSGSNMLQAFKQGQIDALNEKDWKLIGQNLGSIAMFDLLIGNDDRLVRFVTDENSYLVLKDNPEANGGNLMLELPIDQNSLGKRKLVSISLIDNCSSPNLRDPIIREEIEDNRDAMSSLFGGSGDSPVKVKSPQVTESKKEIDGYPDGEILPISESEKPINLQDRYLEKLKKIFKELVSDHLKNGDDSLLVKHILKSVNASINTVRSSEFTLFLEAIKPVLSEGINEAIHLIKKRDIEKSLERFDEAAKTDNYVKRTLDLVRSNIKMINNL